MPKEIFKSQFEKTQDPNEELHRQPELLVSWGPTNGPEVQIGTTLSPAEARQSLEMLIGGLFSSNVLREAELREAVLDALVGPESGACGWYTHLDRYDANRLIRALRKARDAAFGADA